jgi:SAM-dependent methyltransferase
VTTTADIPCVLCGATAWSPLHTTVADWRSIDRIAAVFVICEHCGLVRNVLDVVFNAKNDFYELEYWSQHRVSSEDVFHFASSLPANLEAAMRLSGVDWSAGLLLDVGCGFGHLVATLAHVLPTARIIGLEPDIRLCDCLRRANFFPNVTIKQGGFNDLRGVAPGSVRVLLMLSVFEHLHDPVASLVKCHDLLEDHGVVVMQLPDVMQPGHFGLNYFFRSFHLYYYSETTLRAILTKAGFEVLGCFHGPAFATASGPHMLVVARRVEACCPPPDLTQEAQRIKSALNEYKSRHRIVGPVRLFWRYKIRRPLVHAYATLRRTYTRTA